MRILIIALALLSILSAQLVTAQLDRPALDLFATTTTGDLVVSNGITWPQWDVVGNSGSDLHQISASQPNITFVIKLENPDAPLEHKAAIVTSSNAELLVLSSWGPVAELGNFTSASQLLFISFQCESFGETTFEIEIQFVDKVFDSMKFGARKLCGVLKSGFDVSTSINSTSDVVSNGQATAAWNPLHPTKIMSGHDASLRFYASIQTGNEEEVLSSFNSSASDSSICQPEIAGLKVGMVIGSAPVPFDLIYNCSTLGETQIQISLSLKGGFIPVQFAWTKIVGGIQENLQVGSKPRSADVVFNGEPTLAWRPSAPTQYTITDQPNMIFYFQLSPFGGPEHESQTISNVKLSSDLPFCAPAWAGNVSFPLQITSEEPYPLKVVFNCYHNGTSTLRMVIKPAAFLPVQIAWNLRSTAFTAFEMGTSAATTDVVSDGKPGLLWDARFHLMTIAGSSFSDFWMYLAEHGSNSPISIQAPKLAISSSNSSLVVSIVTAPSQNLTSSGPAELIRIGYNCSQPAVSVVILTIDVQLPFAPISIGWNKRCGGYMEFVMVATKPGFSDVIQNGFALPLWNAETHPFNVGNDVPSTKFYLYTSEDETTLSAPTIEVSDHKVLELRTAGNFSQGGTLNPTQVSILSLEYNCIAQGSVTVEISLFFAPFEPLRWAWNKVCGQQTPALSVGTAARQSDVVSEGTATLMWNPVLHTAFVQSGIGSSDFYIREDLNNSGVVVHRISAFAHNTTVCAPYITGQIAEHGGPLSTESAQFSVNYNCTCFGDTVIDVLIAVQTPFYGIKFSWLKRNKQGREGFQIGTQQQSTDIVENGRVTPMWDEYHSSAFFPSWISTGTFYFSMQPGYAQQEILGARIHSEDPICDPFLTGAIDKGDANHFFVDSIHNRTVRVVFNCFASGKTQMLLHIQLANFPDIKISFLKFYGGHRHYFRLGTWPGYNDVVDDGYPLPMWLPGGPLNKEKISGLEDETTIYITMSLPGETQTFSHLDFLTSESVPGMFAPVLVGPAVNGSFAEYFNASSRQPESALKWFTVIYNCKSRGLAFLEITIHIPPFETVAIGWTKDCGVHRRGFSIGTTRNGTDVVIQGEVTYAWNQYAHVAFVFGNVPATTFYLTENDQSNPNQAIESVAVSSSDTSICDPFILNPGSISAGSIITNNVQLFNLTIVYNCSSIGRSNITVEIHLGPLFQPLVFTWTKRVGGARDYFSVGTLPGMQDVALDGMATPAWNTKFHTSFVPSNVSSLTLWAAISVDQIRNNNPWLRTQEVLPILASSPNPSIRLRVGGAFQQGPTFLLTANPVNFTIHHTCFEQSNSIVVISTAPLVAFAPVVMAWAKQCPPNVPGLTVMATLRAPVDPSSGTEAPVARDGLALPAWSFANHSSVLNSDVFNQYFHVFMDQGDGVLLEKITVENSNTSVCTVDLSGSLLRSLVITQTSQDLELSFSCSREGSISIVVLLHLTDGSKSSTGFAFTKTVSGPRWGFSVASQKQLTTTSADVASNGTVLSTWGANTAVFQAAQTVNRSPFFIFMNQTQTSEPNQRFLTPSIQIVAPSPSSCQAFISIAGDLVATEAPLEFDVIYECFEPGLFNFSATIEIPAFDAVQFYWLKSSNGHRLGLNIDAPAAPSRGFIPVVSNGGVTAPWKPSVSAVLFSAPSSVITFALSADPSQLAPGQAMAFSAPFVFTNDSANCSPTSSGDAAVGGAISPGKGLDLLVDLSPCSGKGLDFIVQVTFAIGQYRNITYGFTFTGSFVANPPDQNGNNSQDGTRVFVGLAVGFGALFLITVVILVWRKFRRGVSGTESAMGSVAEEYRHLLINDETDPK